MPCGIQQQQQIFVQVVSKLLKFCILKVKLSAAGLTRFTKVVKLLLSFSFEKK